MSAGKMLHKRNFMRTDSTKLEGTLLVFIVNLYTFYVCQTTEKSHTETQFLSQAGVMYVDFK